MNNQELSYRYRIVHSKSGLHAYLSHLDVLNTVYRMLLRSDLPLAYSSGFSPRPRIEFPDATRTGLESFSEVFEIKLNKYLSSTEVKLRLNNVAPQNFVVHQVSYHPPGSLKLSRSILGVVYSIRLSGVVSDSNLGNVLIPEISTCYKDRNYLATEVFSWLRQLEDELWFMVVPEYNFPRLIEQFLSEWLSEKIVSKLIKRKICFRDNR